jgi:hypothetical protein
MRGGFQGIGLLNVVVGLEVAVIVVMGVEARARFGEAINKLVFRLIQMPVALRFYVYLMGVVPATHSRIAHMKPIAFCTSEQKDISRLASFLRNLNSQGKISSTFLLA